MSTGFESQVTQFVLSYSYVKDPVSQSKEQLLSHVSWVLTNVTQLKIKLFTFQGLYVTVQGEYACHIFSEIPS